MLEVPEKPVKKTVSFKAQRQAEGEHRRDPDVARPWSAREPEEVDLVVSALTRHPLFSKCDVDFIKSLVDRAKSRTLEPDQVLELDEEEEGLFVVRRGVLKVRVGDAQATSLRPGAALNCVGFVGLTDLAHAFRPRRQTLKDEGLHRGKPMVGYDPEAEDEAVRTWAPPEAYRDRRHASDPASEGEPGEVLNGVELAFYSACPYGALNGPLWTKPHYLPMEMRGQEAEADVAGEGGATLAVLPSLASILESGRQPSADKRWSLPQCILLDCLDNLDRSASGLQRAWRIMMKALGTTCFNGVPPEVVWAVVERTEEVLVPSGGVLAAEGEVGAAGDAVYVVAEGFAKVTRRIPPARSSGASAVPSQEVVGRLRPGTVVGDICLLGTGVPRPASVVAQTDLKALRVPADKMMEVFHLYPGSLRVLDERLEETAEYLQERLPTRSEVVRALRLFSGCDTSFLASLAREGQRRAAFFNEAIVREGGQEGTLHVLELGLCAIEQKGRRIAEVPVGNCFGERTLLGIAQRANATVRVSTPLALLFSVTKVALQAVVEEHPRHEAYVQRLRQTPSEGRVKGSMLKNVELFRSCGAKLLSSLGSVAYLRGYLPGQSVVVEGDREEDPWMYVLVGGTLAVEAQGEQVALLPIGATFGELAFLGEVDRRSVTIRAISFCFLITIAKSDFLETLAEHGEEANKILGRLQRRVNWPCFKGADTRLLHLIDLHAERLKCASGDTSLGGRPLCDVAMLLDTGVAAVVGEGGEELDVLSAGQCFNEQIFVGACRHRDRRLVPKTDCELRLLSRQNLQRALAEFCGKEGPLRAAVMRYLAEEAETKLGHTGGGTGAIRHVSAFFECASEGMLEVMRAKAEPRLYEPGEVVCGKGTQEDSEGNEMYVLLSGDACVQDPFVTKHLPPGGAFGEAVLLGMTRRYSGILRTESLCVLLMIRRKDFEESVRGFPTERRRLERLREETSALHIKVIQNMLQTSPPLREMPAAVIAALCPRNNVQLFAPGAPIFESGDPCILGQTTFYLVLAGQVMAEGSEGTLLGTIYKGQVFGEIGAWGITDVRTATCRAWREGLVACSCISGAAITATMKEHPNARSTLEQFFKQQVEANAASQERRRQWLQAVAVPALAKTDLLRVFPRDFLYNVAVNLTEGAWYQQGEVIASAGTEAAAMLLVLEGTADLEVPSGARVGRLIEGATFGEVCALGLFSTWMATVRARTPCCAMEVTQDALRQAADSPGSEEQREYLQRIMAARRDQVATGAPLSMMNVGASHGDISTRVIALLAQKAHIRQGKVWEPVADDSVTGASLLFVMQGQAAIVLGDDRQFVMGLPPYTVLPEGLLAQWGAKVAAVSAFDAYRVRRGEFEVAVMQDSAAKKWIWGFRLKEKEVTERVRQRLTNAHGLLQSQREHELSPKIKDFVDTRRTSLSQANMMRTERAEFAGTKTCGKAVPLLPSLTVVSGWRSPISSQSSSRSQQSLLGPREGDSLVNHLIPQQRGALVAAAARQGAAAVASPTPPRRTAGARRKSFTSTSSAMADSCSEPALLRLPRVADGGGGQLAPPRPAEAAARGPKDGPGAGKGVPPAPAPAQKPAWEAWGKLRERFGDRGMTPA